jgi:hypothetical protein
VSSQGEGPRDGQTWTIRSGDTTQSHRDSPTDSA